MEQQEVEIREAVREDLPAIVALLADDPLGEQREVAADPLPPGYHQAFEEIEADPRQSLLVAEMGGRIVGTLQLCILPNLTYGGRRRAQVEGVRIAAEARGRGIGMIKYAPQRRRLSSGQKTPPSPRAAICCNSRPTVSDPRRCTFTNASDSLIPIMD